MGRRSKSKHGESSHNKYTLNFDGSHINQGNKVGAGCIITDKRGELVVAAAYNLTEKFSDYCDVAIAEAAALRNGLKLANNFKIKLNHIKGDSQQVINLVESGCSSGKGAAKKYLKGAKQPLGGIIQEIVGMLDSSVKIELITRDINQVADKLASFGSSKLNLGGRKLFTPHDFDLPPQLIKKEKSCSNREEEDQGEGMNMAKTVDRFVRSELINQISEVLDNLETEVEDKEANQVADKLMFSGITKLLGDHDNADLPPQVSTTPHVVFSTTSTNVETSSNNIGTPNEVELKCGHNLLAKLCVSRKDGKRFYGCPLWPKTCGFLVWEDELLEGKVCEKCYELQANLLKGEKRIAELEVEVKMLLDQKMKLEDIKGDLVESMEDLNNELRQMRNENMKATQSNEYESIAMVVLILCFIIFILVN
ncbi:DNA topoisomerase 3-alpha [Bienertia sinuspersici]